MLLLTLCCLLHSVAINCQLDKVDIHHRNQRHQDIYLDSIPIGSTDGATAESAIDIASELYRSLSFHPPSLDFGAWSIGTAQSHEVTLVNKNENRSVYLSSVSGKTPDFYSSFFQDKVVPPQGNTTFNVVFLPRSHGVVETNLLIHTSFGQARLLVKGEGRECPYRLKPLVGIRAPLNSTLSPEIHMYNPHPRPLQILEVYSSGGQFQLELPSGGQEGPQDLWEIPPHSTKPVIRIRFNGVNPGNHTAYIRIKIAGADDDGLGSDNILVIPVEFEILTTFGFYSPTPVFDFGRLTTQDEVHTFKVELKNSGKSKVDIIDYELRNIEFPLRMDKNMSQLTLDPGAFDTNACINGELVVKSVSPENPTEVVELVLYVRAEVFKGSLEFSKNVTTFITKSQNFTSPQREFVVRNSFSMPVAILNVTADNNDSAAFSLTNFVPIVLLPGQHHSIFQINLLNDTAKVQTFLRILTNVTTYQVPVIVCTGLLDFYTIDADGMNLRTTNSTLDLGTIPLGEYSHSGYVVIENPNPVPLELTSWDFSRPTGVNFQSLFLGCLKTKAEENKLLSESEFILCFKLKMNDVAMFQVSIQSYQPKPLAANLKIWTEHEQIIIAVKFDTVVGRLGIDQDKLNFSDCFPGKRCSAEISFHSTFVRPLRVKSIAFSDSGLQFEDNEKDGSWILPNTVTSVGRIYFDPRSLCQTRCYIPLNQSLLPMSESLETHLNFDETELRRRTEIFRHFKYYLRTIKFGVETNEVHFNKFWFNLSVDIVWPKLVSGVQTLPTVEVGQIYIAQIALNNPSDVPLLVDFFIANPSVSKYTKLSLPVEVLEVCPHCYLTDKNVFNLIGVHKPRIIAPNSSYVAAIEFVSKEPGVFSTLMHIRNNLTLYEAVWVTAKAVRSQFKFGNKKPGSVATLNFDVGEKQASLCMKTKADESPASAVSIRRSFVARNTGEVPIIVGHFMIDDHYCEGYGFKVIGCRFFLLKANSSKKVEISFTPDFTLGRVMRPLTIITNLSYIVNYTLMASMSPQVLESCSKPLQRPSWETRIKQVAIFVLATSFVFVLVAGHLDSGKVLTEHVQNISREKGPVQPTLNLRDIAMQPTTYDDQMLQTSDTLRNSRVSTTGKVSTIMTVKKRSNKKSYSMTGTASGTVINNNLQGRSWAQELAKLGIRPKDINGVIQTNVAQQRSVPLNRSPSEKAKPKGSLKDLEKHSPVQAVASSPNSDKGKPSPPKVTQKADNNIQGNQTDIKKTPKQIAKKAKATNSNQSPTALDHAVTFTEASPSKEPVTPIKPIEDRQISVRRTKSPKTVNKTETIEKKPEQIAKQQITPEMLASNSSDSLSGSLSTNSSTTPVASTYNGKKYGKTPGRERRKDQSNGNNHQSKRFDRKLTKFKPNAFHFSSPVGSNVTPSIWDPNQQASFSDVVSASQTPSNLSDILPLECEELPNEYLPLDNGNDWNDADLKNDETFGDSMIVPTAIAVNSNGMHPNTNELGPIGTKRSPSSTPSWEQFQNLDVLKPTACNNSSFFSSAMPPYLFGDASQYLGRNHVSYDQDYSPVRLQNQWNANNEYYTSQPQQLSESQQNPTTTWSMSGGNTGAGGVQTWDPMRYKQVPTTAPSWQRLSGIRPPPGLEFPKRDSPIHSLHDQMSPLLFSQQQQQQQPHQQQDPDPPFNPLNSPLSKIWSDWSKNNNNN